MPANTRRLRFCMLLAARAAMHAEDKPYGPQDLLAVLMQNNPEIQAARSRFEEIARNRYTVGKGLQQDVLKAQLEVSMLEQPLAMLDEKGQRAEAEIASLLAIPAVVLRAPGEIRPTTFSMSLDDLLRATAY